MIQHPSSSNIFANRGVTNTPLADGVTGSVPPGSTRFLAETVEDSVAITLLHPSVDGAELSAITAEIRCTKPDMSAGHRGIPFHL
jgi:hypothetical protein